MAVDDLILKTRVHMATMYVADKNVIQWPTCLAAGCRSLVIREQLKYSR